ncbi:MAG TPA: lysylphosphatidylglycerol synthase domain-containing protein [Bacteroidota bacterium]|nr:lysylphosphatidylglycerol synthase domain-containing protein [Bacteroidota bacterium]
MKNILIVIGSILSIVSTVFLVRILIRNIAVISSLQWNIEACLALITAVIISLVGVVLLSYGWKILLEAGNVRSSLLSAYSIIGRAQIAKYLPGNVFHYIGRVALGKFYNIVPEVSLITIGVETFFIVFTAVVIGLTGIVGNRSLYDGMGWLPVTQIAWFPYAVAGMLIAAAFLLSLTSKKIRTWLSSRSHYLSPLKVFSVIFLYAVFLMMNGVSIVLLLRYVWNEPSSVSWYQYSAGFTIAWLLGFIVPGAPGGLGIREAVFVAIFSSVLGDGLAAGVAVMMRIVTTVSDLVTFFIAARLGRRDFSQ